MLSKKIFVLIAILTTSFWLFSTSFAATNSNEIIGTVIAVVNQAANEQGQQLKRGDQIHLNEVLNTKNKSSITVRFKDDSIVSIQENSSYLCDQFKFDQPNSKNNQYVSTLTKGAMLFISGQPNPNGYSVKIPKGMIAIRGCMVYVAYQNGNITVTVLEGTAFLSFGGSKSAAITAGKTATAKIGASSITVVRSAAALATAEGALSKAIQNVSAGTSVGGGQATSSTVTTTSSTQNTICVPKT